MKRQRLTEKNHHKQSKKRKKQHDVCKVCNRQYIHCNFDGCNEKFCMDDEYYIETSERSKSCRYRCQWQCTRCKNWHCEDCMGNSYFNSDSGVCGKCVPVKWIEQMENGGHCDDEFKVLSVFKIQLNLTNDELIEIFNQHWTPTMKNKKKWTVVIEK